MSENYQIGLISSSSLIQTPQDGLQNIESDYTSVFGTLGNDYLKGIPVMLHEENIETPFSYDNVMKNIFVEEYAQNGLDSDLYYDEDEPEGFSNLEFEC
ncbi:MAG: hypothetical protein Q4F80_01730 [bacterium]|nr:hypothetical protein [bacterium]